MKTKSLIIISLFLLSRISMQAQTVFQPKPVEYNLKGIVYDKESLFEIRPHFQGFSIAYKKGTIKSYYRTTYKGLEFGFIKDPNERRQNKNISISGSRLSSPFVYGKQNDLFLFRGTMGEKRYLSEKTLRRGVAMGYIYEGGVTLGLVKPYYLKVIRLGEDNLTREIETIKYKEEENEVDYLSYDNIYGGAGFFKGFQDLRPRVGLHGKIGLHWALGAFDRKVKAIEAGIQIDVFPTKIPLMVETESISNQFIFAKFYASFQFGKRRLRIE